MPWAGWEGFRAANAADSEVARPRAPLARNAEARGAGAPGRGMS